MRRSPLRRVGKGTRVRRAGMAAARAEVRARSRGRCEAMIAPDCVGRGQHLHHRAKDIHDATSLLDVCRPCHEWIHAHPGRAYELGLLIHRSTPCPR